LQKLEIPEFLKITLKRNKYEKTNEKFCNADISGGNNSGLGAVSV